MFRYASLVNTVRVFNLHYRIIIILSLQKNSYNSYSMKYEIINWLPISTIVKLLSLSLRLIPIPTLIFLNAIFLFFIWLFFMLELSNLLAYNFKAFGFGN